MDYNIRLIKNDSYTPTYWSGGMAAELITYPHSSSFAARDFLWRMGCAKIDIDTSTFSSLPGIKRHLMVTDGEMTLAHKDRYCKLLKKFDEDFFMGDWTTTTEGRCLVLNLMTREDYDGMLVHLNISKDKKAEYASSPIEKATIIAICVYPLNSNVNMEFDNKSIEINKNDLLCIDSIISSQLIPKLQFSISDEETADIVVGIIYKNI
ncbi:HutD family protein [uncultured Clostridium sp.]|uniref:HutD family protein n=1 Tax=uncultured Clostridium sp. TaxID=59620 RepID=UPI0025F17606|nr:HutD family protein [uncultured Clostridium sp.]